ALLRSLDLAAEKMRRELHAVADAEDGSPEIEDALVDGWRVLFVHARWPTREDDGARVLRADLLDGHRARVDLTVDLALAYATRDELRGLRAEVEDEDEVLRHGRPGSTRARSAKETGLRASMSSRAGVRRGRAARRRPARARAKRGGAGSRGPR